MNLQKEITNYSDILQKTIILIESNSKDIEGKTRQNLVLQRKDLSFSNEVIKRNELTTEIIKEAKKQIAKTRRERIASDPGFLRNLRNNISNFDACFTLAKKAAKENNGAAALIGIIQIGGRALSEYHGAILEAKKKDYTIFAHDLYDCALIALDDERAKTAAQAEQQAEHVQRIRDVLNVNYKTYYDLHDKKSFINFLRSGIWRAFCLNEQNFKELYKCEQFINSNLYNPRVLTGILVELGFVSIADVDAAEREGVNNWSDLELYCYNSPSTKKANEQLPMGQEQNPIPATPALEMFKLIHEAWLHGVPRLFSPFSWDSALYMTLQQQKNLLEFLLKNEM